MEYLECLEGDDDLIALNEIAAKYFEGQAASAKVEYERCDGSLSSCAYNVDFFDKDGNLLNFKPEYGKFSDIAEAYEETEGDALCAQLSGCDDSEQLFDLADGPCLSTTLYVEEK